MVNVVVNFLSQVVYIFPLFQLYWHTLPYPKTKEKQKLPEIKLGKSCVFCIGMDSFFPTFDSFLAPSC